MKRGPTSLRPSLALFAGMLWCQLLPLSLAVAAETQAPAPPSPTVPTPDPAPPSSAGAPAGSPPVTGPADHPPYQYQYPYPYQPQPGPPPYQYPPQPAPPPYQYPPQPQYQYSPPSTASTPQPAQGVSQPADRARPPGRLLAMPLVGVHSYLGDRGKNFGPGLRLGALLGGRLGRFASLDGELVIDVLNPHTNVSIVRGQLTFHPLVHVPAGAVELVGGPKLGIGVGTNQGDILDGTGNKIGTSSTNYRGWIAGLGAGVFARVGTGVSVGGLLAFELRTTSAGTCSLSTGSTCTFNASGASAKVLSVSAAALF